MDYRHILCDTALNSGNTICLTAQGLSMWPVITQGMRAEIAPPEAKLPEKGTLLLTQGEGGLIVHRCWGVTSRDGNVLVLTKGDTNYCFDAPVTTDRVLGKVTLLRGPRGVVRDPNQGLLKVYGKMLCMSVLAARIWARACRVILSIRGNS